MKKWILKEEAINVLKEHNCFTYKMHRQLEVTANELNEEYINLEFTNNNSKYVRFSIRMTRNDCFEKVEVEDIDPAKVMFVPAKKPNWFNKWVNYVNNLPLLGVLHNHLFLEEN